VTLVEVLIVVAIMALISAAVGFVVIKQMRKARIETTTVRAKALRGVAVAHVALGPGDCPTANQLVIAGDLERDNRVDAWDRPFDVVCEGYDVMVRSGGPDRTVSTEDDIVVPVPLATEL
jgi:general secretion pathway protein G